MSENVSPGWILAGAMHFFNEITSAARLGKISLAYVQQRMRTLELGLFPSFESFSEGKVSRFWYQMLTNLRKVIGSLEHNGSTERACVAFLRPAQDTLKSNDVPTRQLYRVLGTWFFQIQGIGAVRVVRLKANGAVFIAFTDNVECPEPATEE